MGSSRHVWELSRAVLGDQDGFVAVLKFYMDESGIHDGSPVVTVACYAARPKTWAAFTKAWNRQKRPIKIFHAADCQNLHGEFEGWTEEQRDEYVKALLPVIPGFDLAGDVVGIDMRAFEEAMQPHPDLRRMFGSPYSSCFQWCVQRMLSIVERHGSNERLAFFHERNDYQKEAIDAFDWVVKHRQRHFAHMTLTFGSKEDYVPLQIADILAYEANKRLRDVSKPKRRSLSAMDPTGSVSIAYYGKNNMPWLIERMKLLQDEIKVFGSAFFDLPPKWGVLRERSS